jgi:hypothetical protein
MHLGADDMASDQDETDEPLLSPMEIAFRQAQAGSSEPKFRDRKSRRDRRDDMDDIYRRTLEQGK